MVSTESKNDVNIGYVYSTAKVKSYDRPLIEVSSVNDSDDNQYYTANCTYWKESPESIQVMENPFDESMMSEFNTKMDIGLNASIVIFEYTSSYEMAVLEKFPGTLGENILRWVRTLDGVYRRHVIFREDGFSVCDHTGEETVYPYGHHVTTEGDWIRVMDS